MQQADQGRIQGAKRALPMLTPPHPPKLTENLIKKEGKEGKKEIGKIMEHTNIYFCLPPPPVGFAKLFLSNLFVNVC